MADDDVIQDKDVITKEIFIEASPEIVFEFFTDPAKYTRWLGRHAELDPRPGGVFHVDPNGRDRIRGKYVEVVPYSRIVFTWGHDGPEHAMPPGSTTVEVTLTPQGNGTLVRLVHRGLSGKNREGHDSGWTYHLSVLADVAAGRAGGSSECQDA